MKMNIKLLALAGIGLYLLTRKGSTQATAAATGAPTMWPAPLIDTATVNPLGNVVASTAPVPPSQQ